MHRRPRSVSRTRKLFFVESLEPRNLMAGIQLSQLSNFFVTGAPTLGASEISAFDPITRRMFSTNAAAGSLNVTDLSNPASPVALPSIPLGGGPNSVAVRNGIVAVAVEANPKTDPGKVMFFNTAGTLLHEVTVGALPDMLIFSPDGSKVLVANEAEPSGYGAGHVDPEGSVSIIDITGGLAAATVQHATFTSFNGQEAALRTAGVRIYGPGASAAQDFEPEYITISPDGTTAYVVLQENNALATINIATATVTAVTPLGFKNHNLTGNELDASDQDGSGSNGLIRIKNWPVFGIYSPDAMTSFTVGGETFLVMANEGDTRDWPGFNEESRVGAGAVVLDAAAFAAQGFPNVGSGTGGLKNADEMGRLTITTTLGNTDGDAEFEALYAPGGRSFSIRRLDGSLVYDSGSDFEDITAAAFPSFFNASNDNNSLDNRSDNKGPEPEAITVGQLGGRTYAFIGLERIGGVMVYDVTNPNAPSFVQYINNRDFTAAIGTTAAGPVGPEDLKFISAADSPTGVPLLVASNEISGSITIFAINVAPEITSLTPAEPGSTAAGSNFTLAGTFSDDKLAPHQVTVHWGDGSSSAATVDETSQTFVATHPYATGGSYAVSVEISDGVFGDTAETTAVISGTRVNDGVLEIVGTAGNDLVHIGRQGNNYRLLTDFLTQRQLIIPVAGITSISISTFDGHDVILLDHQIAVRALIDAGGGNDVVNSGSAPALILGGAGNDTLIGGSGRNIIIGGSGSDVAVAGRNDDILIGGSTAYDADQAALNALLIAWLSQDSFQVRQAAIQAGPQALNSDTVVDDQSLDLLLGGLGQDWILAGPNDLGI